MALVKYRVVQTLGTNDGIIIHSGAEITIPSERARRLLDTGSLVLANDTPDTVYEEPPEPAPILTVITEPLAEPVEEPPAEEPAPDAEAPATDVSF